MNPVMVEEEEYGFWEDECYFCGHHETLQTNEHYYFCPNCMALYFYQIIIKGCLRGCIKSEVRWTPTVVYLHRETNKMFVRMDKDYLCYCSVCGTRVEADGV